MEVTTSQFSSLFINFEGSTRKTGLDCEWILFLLVTAFVFTMKPHMERKVYNLKISWAMPVLLLSSSVFGLAHVVVAYRKTCGARKKLMYHKIDQEAVKYLLYCFVTCLEL